MKRQPLLPTVTVGIPVYNEEKNIETMLLSVLLQNRKSYVLERIVVNSDGSTDKTVGIVKRLRRKYKIISLKQNTKRRGKATRLQELYCMNTSDFLVTLDADIVLGGKYDIECMVREVVKNKKCNLVAINQIPVKARTFLGDFSRESFLIFFEAAKRYRNGNNVHCVQGSACLLRAGFAKRLSIPTGAITDGAYLYVMATRKSSKGFAFASGGQVRFNTVDNFRDWRILGIRTLLFDKQFMIENFGDKIKQIYALPRKTVMAAITIRFMRNPIGVIGATGMNLFIRVFPYGHTQVRHGKWRIVQSTKVKIVL